MKRVLLRALVPLLLLCVSGFAGHAMFGQALFLAVRVAPPAPPPSGGGPLPGSFLPTPPAGQAWAVVNDDEFNGTSLDTSFWTSNPDGTGEFAGQVFIHNSTTVTVSGGNLNMKSFTSPAAGTTGTCNPAGCENGSVIIHRFPVGGGYFEARLKPSGGFGSAFWSNQTSNVDCGGGYGIGLETDIMETASGGGIAQNNSHWNGYGSCHQQSGPGFIYGDDGNFHVYGVWVDATAGVTYYRDGVQTFNLAGPLTTAATSSRDIYFQAQGNTDGGTPLQVDWFRYYQLSSGGGGGGGTVPGPAQAANFTRLAIDSDFTSAFYSNISNWLGGNSSPCNASNPVWYTGWIGFDVSRCDAFDMAADTAMGVPQALRIRWFNAFAGTVKAAAMESTNGAANAGRMFTNYYAEIVARTSTAQNFQYMDFWSTATFNASSLGDGGQVEWDGWENFGNWGTGIHSWNGPDNCGGHWCVALTGGVAPDANYHRFAWRVTGALNVGYTLCSYYEDVPFSSGLNQYLCMGMSGSNADPHLGGGTVSSIPIFMMFNRDNMALSPDPAVLWIKSIRIYVCDLWTPAQLPVGGAEQCFTSSQNP